MPEEKNKGKGVFYSICFMIFIDSLGSGLIFPILPQLFFNEQLGFMTNFPIDKANLYGLVLALFPFTQFFGMSFFGMLSDQYSKKWLMISGLSMLIVSYSLSIIAIVEHQLILFLFCRALGGFSSGIYSVGYALITDDGFNKKNIAHDRFESFKFRSLSDKLGLMIGPGLSIFVVYNTYFKNPLIIPYLIAAMLSTLSLGIVWYNIRNFPIQKTFSSTEQRESFKWNSLFNAAYNAFKNKNIRLLAISFLLFQFGVSLFIQGLSLYLTINYQYTPQDIGLFFLMMGLWIIFSLFALIRLLSKYFQLIEHIKLVLLATFLIFLYGVSHQHFNNNYYLIDDPLTRIWVISSLFYILLPITRVSFTTLFSTSVNFNEQGWIMGALGQISAFSYCFSALLVGYTVVNQDIIITTTFCLFFSLVALSLYLKYWYRPFNQQE